MWATIEHNGRSFKANLSKPIDISIPVGRTSGPNAFYLSEPLYETVEAGSFIGNVGRGGSCNCEDIRFNPHGNSTHTEGTGHISKEAHYINDLLKQFIFLAELVSVHPANGTIGKKELDEALKQEVKTEAAIIRTLPNTTEKKQAKYSGLHPPSFTVDAIDHLNSLGIRHILTDLPSLDREDDPHLLSHHRFFRKDDGFDLSKTVTEMIYVPDNVMDGYYLLNLQIAPFESDASPSKPVLYSLIYI